MAILCTIPINRMLSNKRKWYNLDYSRGVDDCFAVMEASGSDAVSSDFAAREDASLGASANMKGGGDGNGGGN